MLTKFSVKYSKINTYLLDCFTLIPKTCTIIRTFEYYYWTDIGVLYLKLLSKYNSINNKNQHYKLEAQVIE